jgi:hypothetical protein
MREVKEADQSRLLTRLTHCGSPIGSSVGGGSSLAREFAALHPQTILAYSLNDAPLTVGRGAPVGLRVERQVGYKHAKSVMRIEVTSRLDGIGRGKGGFWEDCGYEWYAGI